MFKTPIACRLLYNLTQFLFTQNRMFVDKSIELWAKLVPPAIATSLLPNLNAFKEQASVSKTILYGSLLVSCGISQRMGNFQLAFRCSAFIDLQLMLRYRPLYTLLSFSLYICESTCSRGQPFCESFLVLHQF